MSDNMIKWIIKLKNIGVIWDLVLISLKTVCNWCKDIESNCAKVIGKSIF